MSTETTSPQSTVEVLNLADSVDHIVCCRRSWNRAFCGVDTSDSFLSIIVDRLCPMCIETVSAKLARYGATLDSDPPVCPEDGTRCPESSEIDRKIADRLAD